MKAPKQQEKKGLEQGIYHAICYSVVDIGTSENKFDGKKKRQIVLGWKLLDEFYPDGNNLKIHKTVTFSMNERATLRKFIASWFSGLQVDLEDFDFSQLLNKGCSLVLAPNMNGNITIDNVMPYKTDGVQLDYVELFDLSTFKGGQLPEGLEDWKKDQIKNSDEYQALMSGGNQPIIESEPEDDVPF